MSYETGNTRSRASAPLSALGLVLTLLSLWGLAAGAPTAAPDVPGPVPVDAGPPPTQVPRLLADEPLELNRANEADLRLLPRIGPTLAARIVQERTDHGCFTEVAELTRVRGIGPATLAQLAPLLSVDDAASGCSSSP
ncbi:MAG: ComEA family DNA-binding protein [Sandaracinaceae bacterium]